MLVNFAVRECGEGASLEQMRAIVLVLRNRVKAGWGGWTEVLENAIDWAAHEPKPMKLDRESRPFQMLLRDIDDLMYSNLAPRDEGWGDEPAKGQSAEIFTVEDALCDPKSPVLYWLFLKRPVRPWFSENIVRDAKNHNVRATKGLMIFYE